MKLISLIEKWIFIFQEKIIFQCFVFLMKLRIKKAINEGIIGNFNYLKVMQ